MTSFILDSEFWVLNSIKSVVFLFAISCAVIFDGGPVGVLELTRSAKGVVQDKQDRAGIDHR